MNKAFGRQLRGGFLLLQILLVLGYDNRSVFSSAMIVNAASTQPTCAVVGVGVLGESLCRQLLDDPDFEDMKVIGITKSTKRHDEIRTKVLGGDDRLSDRLELRTADEYDDIQKCNHCVFCAPPSGFEDYPSAVKRAVADLWMGNTEENSGGAFAFTSSGGIYGDCNGINVSPIVTEATPLSNTPTPRIERLIKAEAEVLNQRGGSVLRLAGLYLLDRGAHNFWLGNSAELAKAEVAGRSDSVINQLHYDDAAASVIAAMKRTIQDSNSGDDSQSGKVFLVSDGNPLTRRQICKSSLKNERYADRSIPTFLGSKEKGDPIGKIYDGNFTNDYLNWKPKYESFDKFMSS
eukprot:CAMPEP_0197190432 /NCGR_PEP_ID=MMETSP1423-20130617/21640_1 /TAXON_ID=476441 /ORGANISM="Pseudo-nitzschia heimii, Strain UNC1101" /LENGTH=347 /DNA_ID=CAMNT_0042642813 /DNA_START=69 /DNA_END=1112 /DNA_ORIENTATION=+